MSLEKNLAKLLEQIQETARQCHRSSEEILLVAVSKGCTLEQMKEAYVLGVRDFAENRVEPALAKMEQLPKDIRWHFIGKLQRAKVKKIIGKFALIHSVDTFELCEKISRLSVENGVKTSILLETNTSGELTKGGLKPHQWQEKYESLLVLKGIQIEGLMTMAPLTEDEGAIRHCFSELRRLKQLLNLPTLSMGMSHDFVIAIQEGATLLRIGTALFKPQ